MRVDLFCLNVESDGSLMVVETLGDIFFCRYVWLENGAFRKEMVFREYLEGMIFPNETFEILTTLGVWGIDWRGCRGSWNLKVISTPCDALRHIE